MAVILVVDLRSGDREELVALLDAGRVVAVRSAPNEQVLDLEVSPRGSFVLVRTSGPAGFELLNRDGLPVAAPPLTGYRAIAWPPGERWAVMATERSTFVFRPGQTPLRLRRLPIGARDLAWR